jgi:hypothetical protein
MSYRTWQRFDRDLIFCCELSSIDRMIHNGTLAKTQPDFILKPLPAPFIAHGRSRAKLKVIKDQTNLTTIVNSNETDQGRRNSHGVCLLKKGSSISKTLIMYRIMSLIYVLFSLLVRSCEWVRVYIIASLTF